MTLQRKYKHGWVKERESRYRLIEDKKKTAVAVGPAGSWRVESWPTSVPAASLIFIILNKAAYWVIMGTSAFNEFEALCEDFIIWHFIGEVEFSTLNLRHLCVLSSQTLPLLALTAVHRPCDSRDLEAVRESPLAFDRDEAKVWLSTVTNPCCTIWS